VIRAVVKKGSEEFVVDFVALPRVGDEITWRTYANGTLDGGLVQHVKHIIYGEPPPRLKGGSKLIWSGQTIEIHCR